MDVGVLQASVEIRIRMKIMCTALLIAICTSINNSCKYQITNTALNAT